MATKAKRRNLSLKQIKAGFGGKRRKASIKAKRRHAPAKRRNPPKSGGRVISGYGSTVMNPRRKKKRNSAHKIVINRARKRTTKKRAKARKRNPELVSFLLGNPAKRRTNVKRRKKRATARKRNTAGRRRKSTRVTHRRRTVRRNPGSLGSPMDWVEGAAGVTVGGVATRAIPQLILGSGNVGPIGYALNAAVALGLGWLSHMFFPRRRVLTMAVVAGGMSALLQRVIADKTSYGGMLSGLGDYLYQDFLTPQRMVDGLNSAAIFGPSGGGQVLVASEGAGAMNNTPGQGIGGNLW